jgi:fucose 4-O-acetylase-like acetyltransferase
MKARLGDIDFIKGIMIFLMVCFHINVGALSNITGWVYSFHMPVFLFYSGYFISTSKPLKDRAYTLFRTLIIPFIIFEVIYISMLYFAGQMGFKFSNRIESLDVTVLAYRIFVNPIGAYWYLHTLIVSMIIIYLVDSLKIKNPTTKIIIVGILCYGLTFLIEGIKFENELFFVLGYFFRVFAYDIYASILSFACIALIFIFGDTTRASASSLGTSFFMVSFLKYVFSISGNSLFSRVFQYLGKNTLIIVLLHPIFINAFKLAEKYFLKIDSTLIAYSILNTAFTICLSLLASYIFDKIRLSGLLFGKSIYIPYKTES